MPSNKITFFLKWTIFCVTNLSILTPRSMSSSKYCYLNWVWLCSLIWQPNQMNLEVCGCLQTQIQILSSIKSLFGFVFLFFFLFLVILLVYCTVPWIQSFKLFCCQILLLLLFLFFFFCSEIYPINNLFYWFKM